VDQSPSISPQFQRDQTAKQFRLQKIDSLFLFITTPPFTDADQSPSISPQFQRDVTKSKVMYKKLKKMLQGSADRETALDGKVTATHSATHCNTLQHTATHCNVLQHIATHCNPVQHTGQC